MTAHLLADTDALISRLERRLGTDDPVARLERRLVPEARERLQNRIKQDNTELKQMDKDLLEMKKMVDSVAGKSTMETLHS